MTETSTVSSRDVAGVVGHVRNPQPMLSANQRTALQLLQEHGGSLIEWRVPETIEKDPVFGTVIPGITVYRKLERMGLVFLQWKSRSTFHARSGHGTTIHACAPDQRGLIASPTGVPAPSSHSLHDQLS